MNRRTFNRIVLATSAALAVGLSALCSTDAMAQTRSVPTFAPDPGWPHVPPQWKLGDISSIAINAEGTAFVLHRPRTLKPEEASKAAPPVMVFDPNGNYVKSWGGDGPGYEWIQREHGIHIDNKG